MIAWMLKGIIRCGGKINFKFIRNGSLTNLKNLNKSRVNLIHRQTK